MSNTSLERGIGVTMNTLSGALGGNSFDLSYGPMIGNLWFDNDSDNDGVADDATTLGTYWHFDHTTSVGAGKSDFYSVALHEILHSLGFSGSNDSFAANSSGLDWTGAEVIAELGDGTGALHTGASHIANGTMSQTLDGVPQEAVMDPSITTGTRKEITTLDLAFLRDMGYETVPEPSSALLIGLSGVVLLRRRR